METIKVYSPVEDKKIKENLKDSIIWKQCFHEEDLQEAMKKHKNMFEYQIKFDGLKPIMVNKISKVGR